MARVVTLKPAGISEIVKVNNQELMAKFINVDKSQQKLPAGIITLVSVINENRIPKVKETARKIEPFRINSFWNFNITIESLTKTY